MKTRIFSLILSLVAFIVACALAGCGEPIDGDPTASASELPSAMCDPYAVQGAVKCDVSSSYLRPGPVLCFENGKPRGGCYQEEKDTASTPVYQVECVAACPQGTALMSPEAIAFLQRNHPDLYPVKP